ncbi:hypothetical protein ACSDR0_21275 [Streptosporangium sp. G11]
MSVHDTAQIAMTVDPSSRSIFPIPGRVGTPSRREAEQETP